MIDFSIGTEVLLPGCSSKRCVFKRGGGIFDEMGVQSFNCQQLPTKYSIMAKIDLVLTTNFGAWKQRIQIPVHT